MPLNDEDLQKISTAVESVVRQEIDPLKKDMGDIKKDLHSLTSSVDQVVHKGVATEDELAVA